MLKEIKDILNKQQLRHQIPSERFEQFKQALLRLKESIQPDETEEHNKEYIKEFLRNTFYGDEHLVNTADKIDCAIYQTTDPKSSLEVLIEVKAPNNPSEFPVIRNDVHYLNCKATQELVLYFRREWDKGNNALKHLIITNGYEWYIIDAKEFKKHFVDDVNFKKEYKQFVNPSTIIDHTADFYARIAKPQLDKVDIDYAYVDIRKLGKKTDLLDFYRILQPAHLLREIKFADSNKLNTAFYNELLHIIGLEEHKVDNKNVIERKPSTRRNINSLLESTIYQLEDYGVTSETEQFDIALNLVITWINRILFLKLLESQLISYHRNNHADDFRFLTSEKIKDYDDLNELFFKVLAVPTENRSAQVKEKFQNIPYLNSSLFELTENEVKYFRITGLKLGVMPLFAHTVLKDRNGNFNKEDIGALEYLFRFMDAYDFGSDQSDDITKAENKTLINASVLGLIFEKINGYKDGSFFTPAFITQYMCREAIERTVIQKFNEHFGWNCLTLTDIYNNIKDKQEAIALLDNITLCDPAVGSGHFLVSALNRLIAIRAELGLLQDEKGKALRDYSISIDNDELIVLDEEGELFHYNPNSTESQRVQKTLFELKRRIIENNLFGADINPNSVNICRLRLWIELLKNAYYKDSQELETLPNIDINIKCGDSLLNKYPIIIGESFNIDNKELRKYVAEYKHAVLDYKQTSDKSKKQAVKDSIEQIKYRIQNPDSQLNMFDMAINRAILKEMTCSHSLEWMIEYPEVLDDAGKFAGFDIIIGNPPYIQLQADGGKLATLYAPNTSKKGDSRNNYKTYARTGDIYCLFYERGYQLLKPNGILCFITSNKWMRAGYGEKTREFLSTQMTPDILIDFAGIKVFENATVDTNILLVTKAVNAQRKCTAVSCQDAKMDDIKNLSDYVQSPNDSWVILSSIEQSIKDKIEAVGTPLRDWDINIYRGVLTGYNDAFIIDSAKREEILTNCQTEDERIRTTDLIRPILRGRDIKRYGYDWDGLWLINTHNGVKEKYPPINIEDYPSIKQHLDLYWDKISKREDQGVTPYNLRNCAYMDDFNKPKIMWKRVGSILRFSFDDTGKLGLDSTCFATGTEIAYLCCVLNSPMGHFLLKDAPKTGTGDLLISVQAVEPIKVPKLEDSSLFATYLQRYTSGDTDVEKEINSQIYALYNLSEEEIDYIEKYY